MKVGQCILFILAVALLLAHTDPGWFKQHGGQALQVDEVTIALLVVLAISLVLPRVTRLSAGKEGIGIELGTTAEKAEGTAREIARENNLMPAARVTEAEREASANPLLALEISRRSLAAALLKLATARSIDGPASNMTDLARQLQSKGIIDARTTKTIADIASTINTAQEQGSTTPGVAFKISAATQYLVETLEKKATT